MGVSVVSLIERPDLVEITVRWRWELWFREVEPFAATFVRAAMATASGVRMPIGFVLLVDGEPVGTASLCADDLEERPELTPWLAGVFVAPAHRGRGYAGRLVAKVEDEAQAQGYGTLWLYTGTAEPVYARLGWRTVEHFSRGHRPLVLMNRDLV